MMWVEKKNVAPYSALAPIYDKVMAHVNYRRWASYIHDLVSRFRPESHWIADLSCGTGSLCLLMEKYGYHVTGIDSSRFMLRQAALKFSSSQTRLICADLCSLPLREKPDVVVSLYDSMNYLLRPELWRKALQDIHFCLQEGGLFIFDVSTIYNSQRDFSAYIHKESFSDGKYHRRSTFDKRDFIQTNYFEIKLSHKPRVVYCETHRQKIQHLDDIVKFIEKSPFRLIAGYKEFSFEPYRENCERVHFVLEKSENYARTS